TLNSLVENIMARPSGLPRTIGAASLAAVVLIGALRCASTPSSSAVQSGQPSIRMDPSLARGNKAGEWRFWGADAWSTRYSPLDQINASNFNNLQVAWQWNAAQDGEDEYYRTTPLYANGR